MAIGNYNPVSALIETDTLVTHALFKSCLYEDKRKQKESHGWGELYNLRDAHFREILGHLYYKYSFLVYNHLNFFKNKRYPSNAFALLNKVYLI